MSRTVIHIDITDFHIAVERVLEPRLRNRPVAVAIETASRSLVYAVSREATRNGIHRGMPLNQALKYCPDLAVLPPNEELYARADNALMKILQQFTPVLEPLRFGHAYLDMTGSGRLFGSILDAAARARHEIQSRLNLEAAAGVAGNKLVSKVASDVIAVRDPRAGLCDVHHGEEQHFLSPLHVGYLPGVQKEIRTRLYELNIRLIRELAVINAEHLQMAFGRFGLLLHERSHGIDNRPVQPPKRSPEIVDSETLAEDSNDYDQLRGMLFRLLSACTRRLRQKNLFTRRLLLEIRYSDHKEERGQVRTEPLQNDWQMLKTAESLLERTLNRRVRVRKMILHLCDLEPANGQLTLFDQPANPKIEAVTKAMDKIRSRFGETTIRFGRAA
jgi:DNA polymerase IV